MLLFKFWAAWVVILLLGWAGLSHQNVVANETHPNGTTTITTRAIPIHDPWQRHSGKFHPGIVPPAHSYDPSKRQQQTQIHLTFQPAPEAVAAAQNGAVAGPLPTIHADYATNAVNAGEAAKHQSLIINPADIQFSVPDVSDTVGKKIIDQIRAQLGNRPVSLGELNNHFISFTAEIPGVMINRTMLTNVEETTVVDQNKSSRTIYKAPTGSSYTSSSTTNAADHHPSKMYVTYEPIQPIVSLPYNPAAPAAVPDGVYESSRSGGSSTYSNNYGSPDQYQKSYAEQKYQYTVPKESSYSQAGYQSIQVPYQKAPEPYQQPQQYAAPAVQPQQQYQKPPESYQQPPAQPSYQKPVESYQKPPEQYQKPQEPYQQPQTKAPYQKPSDSYAKPAESYTKPQESYQKPPESYSPPPPPPPSYKPEEPKVIYKYIEVCSYPQHLQQYQPQVSYQQPQVQSAQYQVPTSPYAEVASGLAGSGYSGAGSSTYGLGLGLGKATDEAASATADGYNVMAKVYGKIHEKMSELEQLQRNVQEMQKEVNYATMPIQMPDFAYAGPPIPPTPGYGQPNSYTTTVTTSSYSKPPVTPAKQYAAPAQQYAAPAAQPQQQYQKPPESYQQQPPAQPSYQAPPQPQYQKPPQPSYPTAAQEYQKASAATPYPGNQMQVKHQKVVEKISYNSSSSSGY